MSDEQPQPKKLTAKQKKFVTSYVACLNASQAARDAGYSEGTAHVIGSQNLRKLNIRAEIDRIFAEQAMNCEEVTARLSSQARADIADIIDPATNTIDWTRARDGGHTHLIKKFRQRTIIRQDKDGDEEEEHIFEVELHDAQKALVHIGKALGMFVNRIDLGLPDGPVIVFKTGMDTDEL